MAQSADRPLLRGVGLTVQWWRYPSRVKVRRLGLVVFLLLSWLCLPVHAGLAESIEAIRNTPPFDRAVWGVLVEDGGGRRLVAVNADTLLIPASNRKIFTAAAALECFGVNHQFTTELLMDGEDVVVRGGGDPSLGNGDYEPSSSDFQPFVAALQSRQVRRVGNIIVDVSAYGRDLIPGAWKLRNLEAGYSPPIDAIAFAGNTDAAGHAVVEPALHAGAAFRDALVAAGISVAGTVQMQTVPGRSSATHIATIASPFLHELLWTMLHHSDNLYAETLEKDLVLVSGQPSTYAAALAREHATLLGLGLHEGEFYFEDGSGLATDDLITPAAAVRIFRWMHDPARWGIFEDVLAAPGNEGTLRRRLSTLAGRFWAKGGTLNQVNSLSGVVIRTDGSERYFSIIINHHTGESAAARALMDQIVTAIDSE